MPSDVERGNDDDDDDFKFFYGEERFGDDRRLSRKLSTEDRRQLGAQTMTVQGLVITDPVASDPRSPWVCTGHPNVDKEWSCLRYNATDLALSEKCPPGNKHQFKSQVSFFVLIEPETSNIGQMWIVLMTRFPLAQSHALTA